MFPFAAVAAAAAFAFFLNELIPGSASSTLFIYVLPVAGTAFAGGRTAGLIAALLSLLAGTLVSASPAFVDGAPTGPSITTITLFAGVLIGAGVVGGYLRDAQRHRQLLYEAERARARQQQTVATISQLALTGDDPVAVMKHAVQLAAEALDVEYAKVLELLPGGSALILRAGHGFAPELVDLALVPSNPSSQAGYTLQSGNPVIVEDLRAEARFPGAPILRDHGVVSGISVVVQGAGRPYGIFGIHSRRLRRFTQDDVYFVTAVANVLGAALQRHAAELAMGDTNERLRVAIEAGRFGTWEWNIVENRVIWSAALEAIHGLAPGAFGGTFDDFQRDIHPDDRARVLAAVREAIERSGAYEVEYQINRPDGSVRWLSARGIVLRNPQGRPLRMHGVCSDITVRKSAERERETLLSQERQARADAEGARERLAFLAEASTILAATLDYEETLVNLAGLAVPGFADWCAVDLLREDGSLKMVALRHRDQPATAAAPLHRILPMDPHAGWGPQRVVRTGRPELYPAVPGELNLRAVPDEFLAAFPGMGLRMAVVVPLVARGRILGAFTFAIQESERRFGDAELQLAQELAWRAGLFVDNARLYHREHRIAVTLQQALLPTAMPEVAGLRFDAAYQPAVADSEVGGDWYDAFTLQDGRIVVSIGDVAGRGLRAAVAMGLVRQAIRAAAHEGDGPASILTRAGRVLALSESTAMATALVGVLDPVSRLFTHASAGHPPPYLATTDGEVAGLGNGGLPLGTRHSASPPPVHVIDLPLGALLLFYTDGLVETERRPLDGEDRLRDILRQEIGTPSRRPAQAVLERMLAKRSSRDDVAVLAIAVDRVPPDPLDFRFPAIPSSLPLIRQGVRQMIQSLSLDPERIVAIQIAVGEAANNVIEHAYGLAPGEIRIRASRNEGSFIIEVQDSGEWRRPRVDRGGRGLTIMRGLADETHIERGANGTTVRLVMHLEDRSQGARA